MIVLTGPTPAALMLSTMELTKEVEETCSSCSREENLLSSFASSEGEDDLTASAGMEESLSAC